MASTVAFAQDPETVDLGGTDPLRQWVEEWAARPPLNIRASIEGPRAAPSAGDHPGSYPADLRASVVADAAAVANATGPIHYDVVWLGERAVFVARDPAAPNPALLDARIDLPRRTRTILEAMTEWADAVHAATGDTVVLGHGIHVVATTDFGGSGVVARDALASILDAQHTALVWSLTWTGSAWNLSVRTVWAVVEQTPPPNVQLQPIWNGPWPDDENGTHLGD
jgi:hypothetical protein